MQNVSVKDLIAFGRVLEAIGHAIKTRPEILLDMLEESDKSAQVNEKDLAIDLEKIESFSLFDVAKTVDEDGLVEKLSEFSIEELRFLIKKYHLGSNKSKSKDRIVRYISEQAHKRSVDVFRKQNNADTVVEDQPLDSISEEDEQAAAGNSTSLK